MHPRFTHEDQMSASHSRRAEVDQGDLAERLQKLHALRMAALTGGHYDPDEFDEAVLSFRRAWEESRQPGEIDHRQVA